MSKSKLQSGDSMVVSFDRDHTPEGFSYLGIRFFRNGELLGREYRLWGNYVTAVEVASIVASFSGLVLVDEKKIMVGDHYESSLTFKGL